MKIKITIKGQKEPIIYRGDRIDVLDFEMNGEMYKQIRYFRKGFFCVLIFKVYANLKCEGIRLTFI